MAARLPVFPGLWTVGFQGSHMAREQGIEVRQVKMPQSSLLLPKFHYFSCINASWITASLWPISRVLKKLPQTIFACVLCAFMEERSCGGRYFTICTAFTSHSPFWSLSFTVYISCVQLDKSLWVSCHPLLKSENCTLSVRKTSHQFLYAHTFISSNKTGTSAVLGALSLLVT